MVAAVGQQMQQNFLNGKLTKITISKLERNDAVCIVSGQRRGEFD